MTRPTEPRSSYAWKPAMQLPYRVDQIRSTRPGYFPLLAA